MVVGFTTTYAISAYHHWCCQFESRSGCGVQHYVIKFVSDLWQVCGFLRVLQFPPPTKLTPRYNWNIVESGVKHHQANKQINNIHLISYIILFPLLQVYLLENKVCPSMLKDILSSSSLKKRFGPIVVSSSIFLLLYYWYNILLPLYDWYSIMLPLCDWYSILLLVYDWYSILLAFYDLCIILLPLYDWYSILLPLYDWCSISLPLYDWYSIFLPLYEWYNILLPV